ncbi:expressed unknown protein [Seminavis robusta]|uniref:Uncharacterized protein n=1 Tax=Seminavis robusta TaxID=568900 RepID=A0A9N8DUG1_9STRA|nr:expressed unknown protein [Seminavis robusta]|eukprot:Sro365_g127430.1 n/a (134) ;mRNA; f:49484-49885
MAISRSLSLKRPRTTCLKHAVQATKEATSCESPKAPSSMKRVVSFEDKIQVIKVQRVDSSLKNELYYRRSDFRRFKKESKQIMNMLDRRLRLGSSSSSLSTSKRLGLSLRFPTSSSSSSGRHKALSLASFRLR